MSIKSKDEQFTIPDNLETVDIKVLHALINGGFFHIDCSKPFEYTANYDESPICGNITIILKDSNSKTDIDIKVVAKTGNMSMLFSSPCQKILEAFKSNLE